MWHFDRPLYLSLGSKVSIYVKVLVVASMTEVPDYAGGSTCVANKQHAVGEPEVHTTSRILPKQGTKGAVPSYSSTVHLLLHTALTLSRNTLGRIYGT